jgi:TonB family protein
MLFIVAIGLLASSGSPQAQSSIDSDTAQTGVFLAKLRDPVYPLITRSAGISGDVHLALQIRNDGTIQSVEVVSGPPLLQRAALDSAQQSQFECRACTGEVTAYSLVYSFQFSHEDCCNSPNVPPKVEESQNHIWITAARFCFCDPSGMTTHKVRSVKCLYLWKCATR